jgi:hypothetical protein
MGAVRSTDGGRNKMRALTVILSLSVACLAGAAPASAQEGHPLKGSWIGTWGPSQNHADDIVVILNWDGKAITGMVNPGTDNLPIRNATLDPNDWVVRFELEHKDRSGNPLNYVVEGKIEGLAFPNRAIVGSWRNEREKGAFKISRQ